MLVADRSVDDIYDIALDLRTFFFGTDYPVPAKPRRCAICSALDWSKLQVREVLVDGDIH